MIGLPKALGFIVIIIKPLFNQADFIEIKKMFFKRNLDEEWQQHNVEKAAVVTGAMVTLKGY